MGWEISLNSPDDKTPMRHENYVKGGWAKSLRYRRITTYPHMVICVIWRVRALASSEIVWFEDMGGKLAGLFTMRAIGCITRLACALVTTGFWVERYDWSTMKSYNILHLEWMLRIERQYVSMRISHLGISHHGTWHLGISHLGMISHLRISHSETAMTVSVEGRKRGSLRSTMFAY